MWISVTSSVLYH